MSKKISVFLAIFFLAFFIYYGNYVTVATKEEPALPQIINILKDQPVQINEWSLYAREALSTIKDKKSFEAKFLELKETFPSFDWEIKGERETWRATGTSQHQDSSLKEEIELVWTLKNERAYTYLLYSVKGDKWEDKQAHEYVETYDKHYHKLFTFNPIIFSCVKGQFNDKIESVLSLKVRQLLDEFQAVPTESLIEESFVSVSAYTEMWKEALPTRQHRMNLQIGLRETGMGGKTTFVVGTPIITSEY
ncbi:YwmB family TATA-box binding protein [Bacillus songklensis]|uniref:YwmB family TATA-box binding protein n=1 Tax=Bacillus songklensis TaxID=1069116 RepID=A0ABV8BBG2_9BACI